jgi:hypothetical protein
MVQLPRLLQSGYHAHLLNTVHQYIKLEPVHLVHLKIFIEYLESEMDTLAFCITAA